MTPADLQRITDPKLLDNVIVNAIRHANEPLRLAALRRKVEILGGDADDPLEVEMQRVIAAREEVLFMQHGRRLQANRLRKKHAGSGAQATFEYLASNRDATEGYDSLVDNGMIEFTAEHVVLRYPDRFSEKARTRAAERLAEVGVTVPPAGAQDQE